MSILDNTAIEQQLLAMGAQKSASDAPAASKTDGVASGPQAFVQRYADLAASTGAKLGVAPEVLLGQWGLETGWGKSIIPGTNNLGNIKGKNGPVATDNQTGSRDSYRAYKDDADFGNGFTAFIGNSERYQGALNSGADAGAYFAALKKGGYAEDPEYVQKGVNATRMASKFMSGVALPAGQVSASDAPVESPQYHWGTQDGPTRTIAAKPASFSEKAADTAIALGSGLLGGAKSLTDVFGADNSASQFLGEQSKNVDSYTSDERKSERAASQEKIRQAELYGSAWDEIKANIGAFADAPIDIVVGAVGSSAPTLLSMFIPGLGQTAAVRLVMGGAMGAAQGTGAGKGSIYEAVENKLLESGIDQDTAKKTAAAAQAYDGQNGGMIAANGIMGAIAGLTGVEGSLAKMLSKKVAEGAAEKAAPGLIKTFAKGVAQESPIEGAQGGLERISGNVALQNQGYDTPTFQGAAGQAAMESLASAPMGGGFALLSRNGQPAGPITPPNPLEDLAKEPGAVLSRAAIAPDDIAQRAHEIEGELKDSGGMQALRSIGEQHVAPFLEALSIAKDKRLPAAARQEALDTINLGMEWMAAGKTADQPGTGQPFSTDLTVQPQPGTSLATAGGSELTAPGMPQAFDPNTIDGEATRVDNMLDGPKALPAPPGPALTNQTPQTPAPAGVFVSGLNTPQAPVQSAQAATNFIAKESENTDVPQATQSQQATQEGQEAPAAAAPAVDTARKQVTAPKVSIPDGKGTAQMRKRKAQLDTMVAGGFDAVERRDDGFYLINHKSNEEMRLDGMGDAQIARVSIKTKMDGDSHAAPSSPLNDKKAPSEAQIEAGNYHKPVTQINGFKVRIENPNGSTRSGTSPDGKKWSSTMAAHYGELEGTLGADGDRVDVFIGNRPDSDKIYVIDQKNKDGSFDEHKVMMGYLSLESAKAGYLANYEKGWTGMGAVTEMGVAEFKAWVKSQEALKPVAYTDPKTIGVENDEQGSDSAGAGLDSGDGRELSSQQRDDGGDGGDGNTDGSTIHASRKPSDATQAGGADAAEASRAVAGIVAANESKLEAGRVNLEASRLRFQKLLAEATGEKNRQHWSRELSRLPSLATPNKARLEAFAALAARWGAAFGTDSFAAYFDDSRTASDGFAHNGVFFVNLSKPQMALQWSFGHEFEHITDGLTRNSSLDVDAQIQSIRQSILNSFTNDGRKQFYEGFLVAGDQYTGSPRQLELVNSEMLAEFMGARFTDRAWLEQLAKTKPATFGSFVREWISTLNNIIATLKSTVGIGEDSRKNVDRYIKDLETAKLLAMELAEAWAKRNPKFAQASTGSVQMSARAAEINELGNFNLAAISVDEDLDMVEFLRVQAEFDAQRQAPKADPKRGGPVQPRQDIADAEIQANGLAAEDAYGDATWAGDNKSATMLSTTARSLYKQGDTSSIYLMKDQDGRWGTEGGILGTWIGNDGMSTGGTTSLAMAKKFVSRFIASKDLFARKFDIAETFSTAARANLLDAWNTLNKMDGVRKFAKADKTAMSMKDIAKQLGVTDVYDVSTFTERQSHTESLLMVEFTNIDTGETQEANLTIEKDGDQRFATAHTGSLTRNGVGTAFYQMAVEYAARNRLVIRPDDSLSGVNSYRRTEQMLSSAMRASKSNVMVPHSVQRIYGFQNDAKTQDEHDSNVVRLLLAGLRNARELAPEMGLLNYHPATDTFTLKNGKDAAGIVERMLANEDARAFGLGRSTLARAVLTDMALQGQLDVKSIQSIASPLMYSAREDAELEFKLVEEKYKGTDQWLKAPDGSQTQLTKRQWVQVRTPQFKEWFGDFEISPLIERIMSSDLDGSTDSSEMSYDMRGASLQSKIFDAIILSVPIDVMNNFGGKQRATEMLLHDPSMFIDVASAGMTDSDIVGFASSIASSAGRIVAGARAKLAFSKATSSNAERLFALHALQNNLVYVWSRMSNFSGAGGNKRTPIETFLHGLSLAGVGAKPAPTIDLGSSDVKIHSAGLARNDASSGLTGNLASIRAKTPSSGHQAGLGLKLDSTVFANNFHADDYRLDWADVEEITSVSKVVGSDGEPLVVYHGTDKGGFMAFNQPGGAKRGDLGIFTTSNESMARSYVRKGRPQDLTPPSDSDVAEWWNDEGGADEEVPFSELTAEQVRDARDRYQDEVTQYDTKAGIYGIFANIRNPNETNFEGALWGGERPEQYVVSIDGEQQSRADGKMYFTREEAEEFAKEHPNPLYPDDDGSDYIEPAEDHYETTDDAVREGLKHGHDGTIIREVVDDGGGIGYDDLPSDVFVANKPEQLKSADWNTGEFGSSDDLRFSEKSTEAASAQHQMEIEREEREIAATTRLSAAEQSSIAVEAGRIGIPKSKLELEVRRIKAQFPASAGWAPMEFDKINKAEYAKKGVLSMGTVEFKKQPYDFHLGRDGKDDVSTHNKRVTSVAKGISDEIIDINNRADQGDKNAEITMKQIGWYSKVASMLHHQFGGFADFLAQLMGPTSANTPVEGNVKYAMAALKSAMSGKWDSLIADTIRWHEGVMQAAAGLDAVIDANRAKPKAERLTGKALAQTVAFKDAMAVVTAAAPYQGEVPQQDSGAKFGMATQGVVEILAGVWSDFQRGDAPKTKNYYQNLIGRQFTGATIDVWAARTLRRMAGLLRLPTSAEKGVAGNIGVKLTPGAEFGFGQEAFVKAAENLRNSGVEAFANTTPADVQAMIWFSEKESWARNNWTNKIGEGGSAEAEFNLQGNADRDGLEDARRLARKGLPHSGNTKPNKTEEGAQQASIDAGVGQFPAARETPQYKERLEKIIAKAVRARNEARVQFESMRGAADRWIAGVTPATDFTPTDATMAEVGAELESKVAMGADAHKVLAFKALPTMGRYGYDERSIDFEGVTRQGYNGVDMLKPLLELAKDKAQDGLLFGRVLRADEDIDYLRHRPGLELYLAKGMAMEKAQPLLDKLNELGFKQFTFVVDPVRTPGALSGKMGDVVGLRYIYTPEFALRESNPEYGGDPTWAPGALTDDQIRSRMVAKAAELDLLADQLRSTPGVSSAALRDYEANVYFWGDYDNALGSIASQPGERAEGQQWQGDSIRAGLEGADRRREMDSGSEDAKSFAARRDVLRRDSEPAFSRRDEGYSGRDGAPDQRTIRGAIHYGKSPGLSVLSGSSHGTGIKGAEQERLKNTKDPRLTKRVYFYPPIDGGIPQAEIGLGGHVYRADLDGIYDLRTATKPIRGSGDAFETALLDAGYKGYINPEQGAIVVLNHDVQVVAAGMAGDHKIIQRRIERIIPTIQTRLERSELVRKPIGNEMLQIIGARAAIDAVAPSFKLQYGEARVAQSESVAVDGALAAAGSTFQFGEARYSARDLGFYSELSAQMEKATMKQAPAGAWKSFIGALVQKGVKKDEIEWTGINDFLDLQEGKVSKDQILAYLAANGVQVEEVAKGGEMFKSAEDAIAFIALEKGESEEWVRDQWGYANERDYITLANSMASDNGVGNTKYGQYTLPGGENYREVLLTLPDNGADEVAMAAESKAAEGRMFDIRVAIREENRKPNPDSAHLSSLQAEYRKIDDRVDILTEALSKAHKNKSGYRSSHWDQKNILAHIRVDDRTDADGSKVLMVQEVQSDWGQDGKKKGFTKEIDRAPIEARMQEITARLREIAKSGLDDNTDLQAEWIKLSDEKSQLTDSLVRRQDTVPNAPFVTKTEGWLNLALKRIMKLGVDGGYDKVAFVNGAQSADRFSLDKRIASIKWMPSTKDNRTVLLINPIDGGQTQAVFDTKTGLFPKFESAAFGGKALDDVLGKGMAEKVMASPGGELAGEGLKLEQQGMRTFYDSIVPNATKALLKKLGGGQMEHVSGMVADKFGWHITDPSNTTTGKWMLKSSDYNSKGVHFDTEAQAKAALADKVESLTQPGFSITDAMREKVGNGMPLFSMRDAQALDAEQAHQDDAPAAPKAKKYAGAKVDIQVKIEDTGEVATLRMDVHQTIDDFDSRQANMQKLLDCL